MFVLSTSSSLPFPPGFSPKSDASIPLPPTLEDGELPPSAGCAPKEGLVPEFKPGGFRDYPANADNPVVSIFIGNIPAGKNSSWLFNSFKEFGKIVDVYIPGHRSKASNMFYGFVRFASKSAANLAISKMDGIMVEKYHLEVKEARFPKARNSCRRFHSLSENPKVLSHIPIGGIIRGGSNFSGKGPISYAQAVSGSGLGRVPISETSVNLKVSGLVSSLDWLNLCVVATARCVHDFVDMSSMLLSGLNGLKKIHKWGGRKLLLQFQNAEALAEAIAGSCWQSCLSSFSRWEGECVNKSSLVWIACERMPLSSWNVGSFSRIAQLWGTLVAVEEGTLSLSDCSTARLLIESELPLVGGTIEVCVDGSQFIVVVREVGGGNDARPWPVCTPASSHDNVVCSVANFHRDGPRVCPSLAGESDVSLSMQVTPAQKFFDDGNSKAGVLSEGYSSTHFGESSSKHCDVGRDEGPRSKGPGSVAIGPIWANTDAEREADKDVGLGVIINNSGANGSSGENPGLLGEVDRTDHPEIGSSMPISFSDRAARDNSIVFANPDPITFSDRAVRVHLNEIDSAVCDDIFELNDLIIKSGAKQDGRTGEDQFNIDHAPSKAVQSRVSQKPVSISSNGKSSLSQGGSIKAGFFKKSLNSSGKNSRAEKKKTLISLRSATPQSIEPSPSPKRLHARRTCSQPWAFPLMVFRTITSGI